MHAKEQSRSLASRGSHNPLVKELRTAFHKGEITADGHCAIEGVRAIEDAVRSGLRIKAVFFRQSSQALAARLLPQISKHAEAVQLEDAVFDRAVASESPQGVAALVKLREHNLNDLFGTSDVPLVLVAVGMQDPGNLGTLIRSAEAFGASGVALTEGTVSAYNSKVIRAAAGSLFRMAVIRASAKEIIPVLRERGLRLLGTSSHSGTPVQSTMLTGPAAVFVGNEGAGLPKALLHSLDEAVFIPHRDKVESLNAGVAASIVLYEAARQRALGTNDTP